MNINRLNRKSPLSFKFILTVILLTSTLLYIYYLPPTNIFIILPFITLTTSLFYFGSSYFVSQKIQTFGTLFIGLFMLISALIGFELINTILLLSFIIAVAVFFK